MSLERHATGRVIVHTYTQPHCTFEAANRAFRHLGFQGGRLWLYVLVSLVDRISIFDLVQHSPSESKINVDQLDQAEEKASKLL